MINKSNLFMPDFFAQQLLPAVTIEDSSKALKVAEAIRSGGLNVMELPLRTKAAYLSIQMIRENFPDMYIGAGTILTLTQLYQARESGAQFGLAPGFNPAIVKAAAEIDFPFIPGVMTPSEIELAIEQSCLVLKLFPAEQLGGVRMIKALAGAYENTGVKFIPMGGVSLQNMGEYLAQNNVVAIGGSWFASEELIEAGDYNAIKTNTAEALKAVGNNKE